MNRRAGFWPHRDRAELDPEMALPRGLARHRPAILSEILAALTARDDEAAARLLSDAIETGRAAIADADRDADPDEEPSFDGLWLDGTCLAACEDAADQLAAGDRHSAWRTMLDTIHIVATDGKRLMVDAIEAAPIDGDNDDDDEDDRARDEHDDRAQGDHGATLPTSAFRAIGAAIDGAEDFVLGLSHNRVMVETPACRLWSKSVPGSYPDYAAIIAGKTAATGASWRIDIAEARASIDRAGVIRVDAGSEGDKRTRLRIELGTARADMTARNDRGDVATDDFPIERLSGNDAFAILPAPDLAWALRTLADSADTAELAAIVGDLADRTVVADAMIFSLTGKTWPARLIMPIRVSALDLQTATSF